MHTFKRHRIRSGGGIAECNGTRITSGTLSFTGCSNRMILKGALAVTSGKGKVRSRFRLRKPLGGCFRLKSRQHLLPTRKGQWYRCRSCNRVWGARCQACSGRGCNRVCRARCQACRGRSWHLASASQINLRYLRCLVRWCCAWVRCIVVIWTSWDMCHCKLSCWLALVWALLGVRGRAMEIAELCEAVRMKDMTASESFSLRAIHQCVLANSAQQEIRWTGNTLSWSRRGGVRQSWGHWENCTWRTCIECQVPGLRRCAQWMRLGFRGQVSWRRRDWRWSLDR